MYLQGRQIPISLSTLKALVLRLVFQSDVILQPSDEFAGKVSVAALVTDFTLCQLMFSELDVVVERLAAAPTPFGQVLPLDVGVKVALLFCLVVALTALEPRLDIALEAQVFVHRRAASVLLLTTEADEVQWQSTALAVGPYGSFHLVP